MNEYVEEQKQAFLRAKNRLTYLLEVTPNDRINWSPSATSRSPIALIVHSASALEGIQGMLMGKPFPSDSLEDFDKEMRASELGFKTRESAVELLEKNSKAYCDWLDTLDDDKLNELRNFPFGMGEKPVKSGLPFPAFHTQSHVSQLEYLQTIYGDLDWHVS